MAKILVIDDDVAVRAVIVDMLKDAHHAVITAEDGRRGLAMFHSEQPDLVITDIFMPVQEGIQTLIDIRRAQPNAKVIAMSGGGRSGTTDFLKMAKSFGAADIVAKPFDPDDFMHRVTRCLDGA